MISNNTPTNQTQVIRRRFDQATLNLLNGTDIRLLELIDYESRKQAKLSPTGARYSIKPEAYYAACLDVTRETISRSVCKLERLGMLEVIRRRKKKGHWQTNLLKIIAWVWWRWRKLMHSLRSLPHRVTQPSHLSTPIRGMNDPEDAKGGPIGQFASEILARWKQRGIWPPPDTV